MCCIHETNSLKIFVRLQFISVCYLGPSSTDDNVDSPPSTSSSIDAIKTSTKLTNIKTSLNVDSDDESVAGDDFGSTDEVKVFKDEDEPDCSESYQAELLAEKSSLISESEQVHI